MAVSTNNTKAFTDAIKRMASEECRQIDSQTKLLRSQRLTEMKKEIRRKYDVHIDYELSKIRMDINRRLSVCSEESKKELADLRGELTDTVFDNVLERLSEFVKTDEYTDLLCHSIRRISESVDSTDVQFLICERDMPLAAKIQEKLSMSINFKADSEITVGGVRALCIDTGTLIDDTLDIRLEAQKKWFSENSGLKV